MRPVSSPLWEHFSLKEGIITEVSVRVLVSVWLECVNESVGSKRVNLRSVKSG